MKKVILALICTGLLFTGCNKDDDGPVKPKEETITPPKEEAVDPPPAILTGVFRDSEVQGLSFTTATQNGITNNKGEFSFLEGETITFKVGELILGSAVADTLITPISLVKTLDATATIENKSVQNIAAFLQTLDKDADHSNGIEITVDVASNMGVQNMDFTLPIESTLADVVLNVAQNNGTSLQVVYPGEAAENMANALNIEYSAPPNYTLTHLMPTLKAYFQSYDRNHTPASAVYKNTFDTEGKLLSTSVISRFSGKVFYDFNFSGYAADGQPTNGNYTIYNVNSTRGARSNFTTSTFEVELSYDANHNLGIFTELRNGQAFNSNQFTSFNEENRPLAYFRDLAENNVNITFTINFGFTYENGLIKTSSMGYFREETSEEYYVLNETQRDFTYMYNQYDNVAVINYTRVSENIYSTNGEETTSTNEAIHKETFTYDSSQRLEEINSTQQGASSEGIPYTADWVKVFDQNELLDSQNYTSLDRQSTSDYEAGIQISYVSFFNGKIDNQNEYFADGSNTYTRYVYNDDGTLDFEEFFENSASGTLISRIQTYYFEGEIDLISTYAYDSNGNINKIIDEYYSDGVISSINEIELDSDGNISSIIIKDANGDIAGTITYTRNSLGQILTVERRYADGSLWFTEQWDYENEDLSKITQFSSEGTIAIVVLYENGERVRTEFYDADGNLTEVVDHTESGKTFKLSTEKIQLNRTHSAFSDSPDLEHLNTSEALQHRTNSVLGNKTNEKRNVVNQNAIITQHLREMMRHENK